MKTTFLLMAQYDGLTLIPVALVCRDFFPHLTVDTFMRKVTSGEIALPVVRMDGSQKTPKSVHLVDLANYIDDRRKDAVKECRQLQGRAG